MFADAKDTCTDNRDDPAFRIDLRSDTKTQPTDAMRAAIAAAPVGDEQIGEDPSVSALCARVATLLGQEAALFLPSGTMCNHVAILTHTRPGDEVILAASSHVSSSESGGAAALAGVQLHAVPCRRGVFTADSVQGALRPPKRNAPRSALVSVEQTTTAGAIWPLAGLREISATARAAGLRLHMDGARILNAQVAAGVPAAAWGGLCDSVWLDLSKGLGCPVGAVLAGSAGFIESAWSWKFRLGGAMRQAGFLAAAGLYALDHHVDRLAEDHANAHRLAVALGRLPWAAIDPAAVDTNIVHVDVTPSGRSAAEVVARAARRGLGIGADGQRRLRLVTHLGVDRPAVDAAIAILEELDP